MRAREQAPAGVQGRERKGGAYRKVTTFGAEADEWCKQYEKQKVTHRRLGSKANTVFVKVLPAEGRSMPEPQTYSEQAFIDLTDSPH